MVTRDCNAKVVTGPQLDLLPKNNLEPARVQAYATTALTDIREKHDAQKMKCRNKQNELLKRKDELAGLKSREEGLRHLVQSKRAAEEKGTKYKGQKQGQLQQCEMEVKVLGSIAFGTRQDLVVIKNRLNTLENQLRKNRILLQQTRNKYQAMVENRTRTDKMATLIADKFERQKDQQKSELSIKNEVVRGVKDLKEVAKNRAGHLQQLADNVMLQKDDSEKKFKMLMLAHRFMSQLLRDKMDRQMGRFKPIEQAFKSIKIVTGVGDTNELISKFLNKEAAYGELLFKIADNQRKIQRLRGQSVSLQRAQKGLHQEMNQFEVPSRQRVSLEESYKKMKEEEDIAKRTEVVQYNMKAWIRRTDRKLRLVSGVNLPAEELTLQSLLQTIRDLARGCKGEQVAGGAAEDLASKQYQERNVRVGRQEERKEEQD